MNVDHRARAESGDALGPVMHRWPAPHAGARGRQLAVVAPIGAGFATTIASALMGGRLPAVALAVVAAVALLAAYGITRGKRLARRRAFAALGLAGNASAEEIDRAYESRVRDSLGRLANDPDALAGLKSLDQAYLRAMSGALSGEKGRGRLSGSLRALARWSWPVLRWGWSLLRRVSRVAAVAAMRLLRAAAAHAWRLAVAAAKQAPPLARATAGGLRSRLAQLREGREEAAVAIDLERRLGARGSYLSGEVSEHGAPAPAERAPEASALPARLAHLGPAADGRYAAPARRPIERGSRGSGRRDAAIGTVVVRDAQGAEQRVPIGQKPVTVGGSPDCDVVLNGGDARALHVRVSAWRNGEYRVHGIESELELPGAPGGGGRFLVIQEGEELAIGSHVLIVVANGAGGEGE